MGNAIRSGDWRRLYARAHPLALTMAAGLGATGVLLILSPPLFANTIVARALPAGLEYPWNFALIAGGGLVGLSFWRLDSRLEAAGSALLAGCIGVWLVVYISEIPPSSPISGTIPVALGMFTTLGYAIRAFMLTTASQDEQPWSSRR